MKPVLKLTWRSRTSCKLHLYGFPLPPLSVHFGSKADYNYNSIMIDYCDYVTLTVMAAFSDCDVNNDYNEHDRYLFQDHTREHFPWRGEF